MSITQTQVFLANIKTTKRSRALSLPLCSQRKTWVHVIDMTQFYDFSKLNALCRIRTIIVEQSNLSRYKFLI